ncbi:V-type ATP synthase subunit A [Thiohalobacter thiocyanaticus]|uniref:V-type ATP synthase alpha chain n=1 Tax=Thiohalobacter thiocyanaticus TaxID=585455 RepID=A0A426QE23_9GAMM|nr:V-type ATP synthase subunit A [Thiohalobacter thiocyanaticus]RRQ20010.1 V-type ATP synthase subunit A [Thiohalobacter thiocyanaticus]
MAEARLHWVSGPVIRAVPEGDFAVNEAVLIGERRLLGEIIRLTREEIVIQVYEDTTGLRPGVRIRGTGYPLSVKLGPALLGNIFDGLLRPLAGGEAIHVEPGMRAAPEQTFAFCPRLKDGDTVAGGEVFGEVSRNGVTQRVLIPPDVAGKVSHIEPDGDYSDNAGLVTVKAADGKTHTVGMQHTWPVRVPRPVTRRLPPDRPMITGQRILDTLFPIARGGKAALPGGFGTGKTVLQESLAKWCDADIIIYVGCGERGNEMAGVLHEFPQLQDPRTGRSLMERTLIIANTSNMPVAAREASIYTGVTVAEYFRDQGLHVALMADSTSRWAEALREVSGRLGELPGEAGYPAYLSSRLASFYERAGRVTALNGEEGSLSIIGAVSPPSGDFSEPVTTHTKRYVRSFWGLDRERAQARFYPAVHPLQSYAEAVDELAGWWRERGSPHWRERRARLLKILEEQDQLERMARIVGKDALPPRQQCILLAGELINQGYLMQSSFSPTDRYASPERQSVMLGLITRYIDLALQAVEQGTSVDTLRGMPILRKLQRMKEDLGEEALDDYAELEHELDDAFAALKPETVHEG